MKLKNDVTSHGKKAIIYGKAGLKIELVNQADAPRLKNPKDVVVVRSTAIGIRTMPFPVLVSEIDQND